jgi:tetratricopeptide (TPR) repeat protein
MHLTYIVIFSSLLALGCTHQIRDEKQASFKIEPTSNIELVSASSAADYDQIGLNYERLNNTDMAVVAYQKALYLEPQHIASLHHLSTLLMRHNRTDEAIAILEQLVSVEPSAKNNNNLGFAYMQQQNYVKAETAFKDAIALDSQYLKAQNNLALLEMSVAAGKSEPLVIAQASAASQPPSATLQQKGKYLYGLAYQTSQPAAPADEVVIVDAQPAKKQGNGAFSAILKFLSLALLL